ncbi:hypothetical protein GGE67_005408 [Rhizobium leucaenae]|nr:hypothetical protein [Rhizobium leucaenae]
MLFVTVFSAVADGGYEDFFANVLVENNIAVMAKSDDKLP